jgi:hypothetical protein
VPAVPAAAHAACAAKPAGSAMAWKLGEGEFLRGVCGRKNGRGVFTLRSYELDR